MSGERGPLSKPAAHRRGGKLAEHLTPNGPPPPPDRLGEVAKEVWESLAAILAPVGRLTPGDETEFELLCCSISDFRQSREMIDANGTLLLVDGQVVKNPALSVATEATRAITAIGAKFGLSPADRERMTKATPIGQPASRADKRLPPSQGGRPRRSTGSTTRLRVVAPEAG